MNLNLTSRFRNENLEFTGYTVSIDIDTIDKVIDDEEYVKVKYSLNIFYDFRSLDRVKFYNKIDQYKKSEAV